MSDGLRFITFAVAGFLTVFQSEVFDHGRRKLSLYALLDLAGMVLIVLSGKIIQLTLIGFTLVLLSFTLECRNQSRR